MDLFPEITIKYIGCLIAIVITALLIIGFVIGKLL
jgi:hypothetical protein